MAHLVHFLVSRCRTDLCLLAIVCVGSEEEYSAFAAPKRFELAHHSPDVGVKMKQKHAAKQTGMQQQE